MWFRALLMVLCAGFVAVMAGCDQRPADERARALTDAPAGDAGTDVGPGGVGRLRVVASIPPLGWIARGLAGESAEVTVLLRPGVSEHGFEITPAQARALREADVVLLAGFGLEGRVESMLARFPREGRLVIRLEDSVPAEQRLAATACCPLHGTEGHDHAHGHAAYTGDPHAWLDPILMARFVDAAGQAFAGATGDAIAMAERAAALQASCLEVHQRFVRELSPLTKRELVVMHNAYNYLAARYGLRVVAVIRPVESSEPTPADLTTANDAIRAHGVGAVFSEPQFPMGPARRLAELTGVKLETLDPIGGDDWPATMLKNLAALTRGLGEAEPG